MGCIPARARRDSTGFTYLGVLLAIALVSVGLMAVSEVWVGVARREKLIQLEWAGQQYQQAIASYYHASPGGVKAYPSSLNDLLDDRRFLVTRRHLRTLYPNPFTGRMDWEPIAAADGGMQGVHLSIEMDGVRQLRRFLAEEGAQ